MTFLVLFTAKIYVEFAPYVKFTVSRACEMRGFGSE